MKKLIFNVLLGIISVSLYAQQDAMISQYMFSGLVLNPAYAGSHKYYNATALIRKQWAGFNGTPTTEFLSVEGPVKHRNLGVGVLLSNDHIGVSNNTDIYLNGSYYIDLNDRYKLSFGLRGGLSYYTARLTDLKYWDQEDVVFQEDVRGKLMPNFGTGMYLYSDRVYVGLSIPHLINYDPQTTFNFNFTNVPKLVRHYYFTSGVAIDLSSSLVLKPSFLLKYVPNAPLELDINANLLINEKVWVGLSYRSNDAVVGIVELMLNKQFRIGYAYDYSYTMMRSYTGGSHELVLSYDFGFEAVKMKSPRFF